jgi:hypothetical protein
MSYLFYGGGFRGIVSINYGQLASTGNVLACRAITIELEPNIVDLRAAASRSTQVLNE